MCGGNACGEDENLQEPTNSNLRAHNKGPRSVKQHVGVWDVQVVGFCAAQPPEATVKPPMALLLKTG